MPVYGYQTRKPEANYFADIRLPDGATKWEHVKTNLGRKVAYAMIAKHYDGFGKIVAFRDETQMTPHDKEGLEQGSDGKLHTNIWAGYGEMKVYY
jgi:hypothetical protein